MTNTTKHTQADPYVDLELSDRQQKAGHTPGPWVAEKRVSESLFSGKQTASYGINQLNGGRIALVGCNQEDNAHLIAAAPKLLEALEACFLALGRDGANMLGHPARKQWEQAREAIALAEKSD
jgi:hypothetical protein